MLCFLGLVIPASAQFYAGVNAGPLLGRSLEVNTFLWPKNEDWLCFNLSAGYTIPMGFFFEKKSECIRDLKTSGWNLKLVARHNLTIDHKKSHWFWGMGVAYSRQKEWAFQTFCDDEIADEVEAARTGIISGVLQAGYSWNPLHKKSIVQRLKFDFGLQAAIPAINRGKLLAERNYISGVGYTWLPFRSVGLEAIIMVRYELSKRRYGFYKPLKFKRNKSL